MKVEASTLHKAAFWVLGLTNNAPYVIMIAGAKNINPGGVGLVYVCEVLPSLLIQLTAPYWFQVISCRHRIHFATICMAVSFATVAYGLKRSMWLQLVGVLFNGIQSAIGESSLLAYSVKFTNPSVCLASWSSGTGFAGVAGYAWVALFTAYFSLDASLMTALILPLAYILTFELIMIDRGHLQPEKQALLESKSYIGVRDGVLITAKLWPYMIPLVVVYASEYAMMSGIWAAIGFPLSDPIARENFYRNAGFTYQIGVFVARSSGTWLMMGRTNLMVLAFTQVGMFIFFWFVAKFEVFFNYFLLIPCFTVGCIGGLVYVNAFALISTEILEHQEFALAAASVSMNLGVLCADVSGLWIQGCLYSMHRLRGATVQVDCSM